MPFFRNYPAVFYRFGDESFFTRFPDLVRYSEILDRVKLNGSFYQNYTIKYGERPDNVSYKLYGNPEYHWTFYYLNDNLRESGWPLSDEQLDSKINEAFGNTIVTTREDVFDRFLVGQTVRGLISEAEAPIIKRYLDLGQLVLEGRAGFTSGENLQLVGTNDVLTTVSFVNEYDAPIYYKDGEGTITDIDPFTGPGGSLIPFTYRDYFLEKNDEQKTIKVLNPETMTRFISEFTKTMRA